MLVFLAAATGCRGAAATPLVEAPVDTQAVADFAAAVCLEKAGFLLAKPVDMLNLIVAKRLRAAGDLSIEDLSALAKEQGFETAAYTDVTVAQLRHANFPAVLRVRGSRYSTKPDHYVVCLGIKDDQARIYNPPDSEKTLPLECLATRWKGEALLLSANNAKNADLSAWRYESYLPTTELFAAALAAIVILQLLRRLKRARPNSNNLLTNLVIQPMSLIALAALLGYGYRHWCGQGLEVQAAALTSPDSHDPMDFMLLAESGLAARVLKEIPLAEALSIQESKAALFVDAREQHEFNSGHIKGAMCCPASDVSHIRLNMSGIPKTRPMVVYCISANCGKAHYVAKTLIQLGFANVSIYPQGWSKWTGAKEPE